MTKGDSSTMKPGSQERLASARRQSQKAKVLKKCPGAWLWYRHSADDYIVMPKGGYIVFQALGRGNTPQQAWADAARTLCHLPRDLQATVTSSAEETSEERRLRHRLEKIDKTLDELGAPKTETVFDVSMELSRVGRILRLVGKRRGEDGSLVSTIADCPHAAPHRYCQECVVSPCPIGLGNRADSALSEAVSDERSSTEEKS